MRRFVVSGLVPCPAPRLADHYLDIASAPLIWPQVRERRLVRAGGDWWDCATAAGDAAAPGQGEALVRIHRVSPVELTELSASQRSFTVHRFVEARGGCLWSVESRAHPAAGESWERFVRRRRRARAAVEALIDSAAGYFAARTR